MSLVTKEHWDEWLNHPVTNALHEAFKERIEEIKDQIVISRDPEYDKILKGMIWAYHEALQAKPDLIDESEETENEI